MKLPILYYGNPILRTKCQPVAAITPEIHAFIQDMIDTMKANRGQGLAAPQVGIPFAIFIVSIPEIDEERNLHYPDTRIYINPRLSHPSDELSTETEGCLSIPKIWAEVTRPKTITITYQDIHGQEHVETPSEELSRVIMHENDHINGVLFVDRLSKQERKKIEPELERLKKATSQKHKRT